MCVYCRKGKRTQKILCSSPLINQQCALLVLVRARRYAFGQPDPLLLLLLLTACGLGGHARTAKRSRFVWSNFRPYNNNNNCPLPTAPYENESQASQAFTKTEPNDLEPAGLPAKTARMINTGVIVVKQADLSDRIRWVQHIRMYI